MKLNELRIDNYVGRELEYHPDNYFKVLEIGETMKCDCYGDVGFWNIQEFEPIPLTEDWLSKFGFEDDEIKTEEYPITVIKNGFSVDSWWFSIKTCFGSQDVTIVIKHVHQLQNLYFALTGKELIKKD